MFNDKITESELIAWKNNIITKKVIEKLKEDKQYCIEELIQVSQDTTDMPRIRYIAGQIKMLEYLVEFDFLEAIKDEIHTDLV